ncbi:hypothetical protein [Gordonia sp. (in: high G+C Gram-positive bacteria)]|uniref:DUF6891 domain-containing protein n=1 Tax=Gordonia sp. (in: high G+C Gram-positive bacteria) TaxID=84139 RepID=UPI003529CB19
MTPDLYARPADYAVPTSWDLGDDAEYVAEQTWQLALRGENQLDQYLDLFDDELDTAKVSSAEAAAWFTSVIEARRDQQARWGLPLPQTSLERAFAALAGIGVVARGDFTCCGTCGAAEIADERDDTRTWRGYVFFHMQDTDGIFADRTTYLNYGIFLPAYFEQAEWESMTDAQRDESYAARTLALMNDEVVPLLTQHGIGVEWNGSLDTRIKLTGVDFLAPMNAPA